MPAASSRHKTLVHNAQLLFFNISDLVLPVFGRDILLHNPPLQFLPLLLRPLLLLMQLKVLDILRVREILLIDIVAVVILLPVVDLVLVLVVSVVTGPHAEIRELDVVVIFEQEFLESDFAVFVGVEHVEDCLDDHLLLGFADVVGGGVGEAVCAADVGRGPDTGAVVVVQVEESSRVVAGDVVFLCESFSICSIYKSSASYQPCVESPSLRLAQLRFASGRRHAPMQ